MISHTLEDEPCTSPGNSHPVSSASLDSMSSEEPAREGVYALPPESHRQLIMDLFRVLLKASRRRLDIAQVLFEAFYFALDQLLRPAVDTDIPALEEWLEQEMAEHLNQSTEDFSGLNGPPTSLRPGRRVGAPDSISESAPTDLASSEFGDSCGEAGTATANAVHTVCDWGTPQGIENGDDHRSETARLRGAAVSAMVRSALFRNSMAPVAGLELLHAGPAGRSSQ